MQVRSVVTPQDFVAGHGGHTWLLVADHRRARIYVADEAEGGFALDDVIHAEHEAIESLHAQHCWAEGIRAHLLAARRRFEFRHLVLVAPRRLLKALRDRLDDDLRPTVLAAVPHRDALPAGLQALAPAA